MTRTESDFDARVNPARRERAGSLLALLVTAAAATGCAAAPSDGRDAGLDAVNATPDASPPDDAPARDTSAGPRADGGRTPTGPGCSAGPRRGGAHAYFEELAARADCLAVYSLRDPAQLAPRSQGGYAQTDARALAVTYDPAADPDPRRQDAAKITIPPTGNSLPNQVRLPIPLAAGHTDSFLVTWEAWFGAEFRHENTGILNYKNFQISSGPDQIWTEVRARFSLAQSIPPAIARVDVRQYGVAYSGGPNVSDVATEFNGVNYGNGALGPMSGEFAIAPETWTRYWASFHHVVVDGVDWWEFSLWVADETRDAARILDARQIRPDAERRAWQALWLEYNTSTNEVRPGRGPLVAYARNVVMLRNPTDVAGLLRRPTR